MAVAFIFYFFLGWWLYFLRRWYITTFMQLLWSSQGAWYIWAPLRRWYITTFMQLLWSSESAWYIWAPLGHKIYCAKLLHRNIRLSVHALRTWLAWETVAVDSKTKVASLGHANITLTRQVLLANKCKKLNSLKQCLTATQPTSHN